MHHPRSRKSTLCYLYLWFACTLFTVRVREARAGRCALLTGAVEARGDRVEEGVLRGEQSPHHRHPAPRGAAPRSPTRLLLRLSAEAGQEAGGPGGASQPLQERPDPRAATLQCGGGGGAARMPTPSTQVKHAPCPPSEHHLPPLEQHSTP